MKKKLPVLFLCIWIVLSALPLCAAARETSVENTQAQALKALGLFYGVSDTDFDLDRAPSRVETLVLLVRLLGGETAAAAGKLTHPFVDVPKWADGYVAYAYQNQLTHGVSATEFGGGSAPGYLYLTFVLRALGYSDAEGDFAWDDPYALARTVGILDDGVDTNDFLRADAVRISYAALGAALKGSEMTLADKLISLGAISAETYHAYFDGDLPTTGEKTEKNAEEVYASCSPAVFYIEVYDAAGNATASGSGFFIDQGGVAVTNYHVIDGAYSAKIALSESGKVYAVRGVYAYDKVQDYAILQIDGSGFPTLAVGDAKTVVGGSTVFAIGSPLGLQNSISQGLISNPARSEGGAEYIQISAAISHGSSGGALLNKYGEVIGITSASYADGQNLNLAVPLSLLPLGAAETFSRVRTLSDLVALEHNAFNAMWDFVAKNANASDGDANQFIYKTAVRGQLVEYAVTDYSYAGVRYLSFGFSRRQGNYFLVCCLDIAEGADEYLLSFDAYLSSDEETPFYTGSMRGALAAYNGKVIFDKVDGNTAYTSAFEERAGEMSISALSLPKLLFEKYISPAGAYSLGGLGFTE